VQTRVTDGSRVYFPLETKARSTESVERAWFKTAVLLGPSPVKADAGKAVDARSGRVGCRGTKENTKSEFQFLKLLHNKMRTNELRYFHAVRMVFRVPLCIFPVVQSEGC
jgi:hypothetical protein